MQILHVPFLKTASGDASFESVVELLNSETIETHPIACVNWPSEFPDKPDVQFKMVRVEDGLLLKFQVIEEFTKATFTLDNEPVYKDSCVELFIDPSGDGSYYNLEFNALGTLLMAYGTGRHDREYALPEITHRVKRLSSLVPFENLQSNGPWYLIVMIPYTAFWHHASLSFEGKKVRGNLQKCGDDLPVPHYLSWNPIPTPHPDYHRPEYFSFFDFRS